MHASGLRTLVGTAVERTLAKSPGDVKKLKKESGLRLALFGLRCYSVKPGNGRILSIFPGPDFAPEYEVPNP
jgi:hypothetical protein